MVCGVMCIGGVALVRMSREFHGHPLRSADAPPLGVAVRAPSSIAALLVGCAAGLAAAWLIARTDDKGQTIIAAIAAGIAAAAAGKLAGASMGDEPPIEIFFVSIALAAIVSPVAVLFMHGSSAENDLFAARLFAPAQIMPLDWAAGALIGVPIGARWVQGSIERRLATA